MQEMALHSSHGYNKGNRIQCPSLGAPWLGRAAFAFYSVRSALLPQFSWCSVAHENGTACHLDSDSMVLWADIPPKLLFLPSEF